MSTLVQFLASGVVGAPQGRAEFWLRGTSTSALPFLWDDFEATNHPPSNIIQLDQWGSAAVYCDVYCDVDVYTVDNVLLRTYTIGTDAATVEVESPSFTGTDYDGAPANTAGEPVTLADVLDRWATSAGTTNWQVMVDGVATDLDAAFAGATPIVVNVKDPAYGAIGDGVTDDTTAIVAAIAAANTLGRGIVFFPPGTYPVTALNTISNANIVLMGCGGGASIIRGRAAGSALLQFTDNTSTATKRITGLGFVATAAYNTMMDIEGDQQVLIDNCQFSGTNFSTAVIRRISPGNASTIRVRDCAFINLHTALAALRNIATEEDTTFTVTDCKFVTTSSYTGAIISGQNFNVSQCMFDASLVASGTYYHIDAESAATAGAFKGNFTGNTFMDGGSSGYAFDLRGITATSRFSEDANVFMGFTPPEAENDAGHVYHTTFPTAGVFDETTVVNLGSRLGKTVCVDYTGSSLNPLLCQLIAEKVQISYDRNDVAALPMSVTIAINHLPPCCTFDVLVTNVCSLDNVHDAVLSFGNNYTVDDVAVAMSASYGVRVYLQKAHPPLYSSSFLNAIIAWFTKPPA